MIEGIFLGLLYRTKMPGNGRGASPFGARPPPPPPKPAKPTGNRWVGFNPAFLLSPPKKGGAGKTRRMKKGMKTRRTRR